MITAKFGGTSLASASQIRKAADIMKSDERRRYMVVSAPGKRYKDDIKITDLLYTCYEKAEAHVSYEEELKLIENRFEEIQEELGTDVDLPKEFQIIRKHLDEYPQRDYLASRGEYLNAKIIASYLGWPFVEAGDNLFFDGDRLRTLHL